MVWCGVVGCGVVWCVVVTSSGTHWGYCHYENICRCIDKVMLVMNQKCILSFCIALFCTELHCIVLNCIVLYKTALFCFVLYSISL